MTESRDEQVKRLFSEALELSPERRPAFLQAACAEDRQLRDAVEALLAAHVRAGAFLADSPTAPPSAAPQYIGPYQLIERIGEGGFGTVWLAEQVSPVKRRVALKLIKAGMDSGQVIARFESERQALALMDHPNIARIFDAGTTSQGLPYFVMELVAGEPITTFCDTHKLSISQRIDLLVQVCNAVQHAHQKGIVHRDIKPRNVLVSLHDGRPLAKVIDFGIAKAVLSTPDAQRTMMTDIKQMIGTPQYMSPEQAGANADIDTRADIYSLGVLLYELLTGTTPFEPSELRDRALQEIERVIREVDPPNPSTRLSTLRDSLPGIAASRQAEPKKLTALVRGELDWIVMKSLEKDRDRRYQSASGLAADILRFNAGDPVSAVPPSRAYRVRKFVRKHRASLLVGAAILLLLVAGVTGTTIGLIGQSRQRAVAEAAAAKAQEENAITGAVLAFNTSIYDEAGVGQFGPNVTVVQAMGVATGQLDSGKLKDNPIAEINIRLNVARTLCRLGKFAESETQYRKAVDLARKTFAPHDPRLAVVLQQMAAGIADIGKEDESAEIAKSAVDIYDPNNPAHAQGRAFAIESYGNALKRLGRLAEAEAQLREALNIEKGLDGVQALHAQTLSALGELLRIQGRFKEAEGYLREALQEYRDIRPPQPSSVMYTLNMLGTVQGAQLEFDQAEATLLEGLQIARTQLPEGHPNLGWFLGNLGVIEQHRQHFAQAEQRYREVLELQRKSLPPDHPDMAVTNNMIGGVLADQGKLVEAEPWFREAIRLFSANLGAGNVNVLSSRVWLGRSLTAQKRFLEAEKELSEARRGLENAEGVDADELNEATGALVALYQSWDDAEPGNGHDRQAESWRAHLPTTAPATEPAHDQR